MKTTRKILPALAMLLVSAIMLSTASYAWFASNSTVKATGMSVKVKANTYYLEITTPELLGTAENVDAAFKSGVSLENETKAIELVHAQFEDNDPTSLEWYLGSSNDVSNKGGLFSDPIENWSEVSNKYVLYNEVLVRMSPTSDTPLEKLTMTLGQNGNGTKVTVKETSNGNAMIKALRLLAVAYDAEDAIVGAQIFSARDNSITTIGTSGSLIPEIAINGVQYKIELYLYFDGEDETAITNNAIKLDEYVVDVAFSASTPNPAQS